MDREMKNPFIILSLFFLLTNQLLSIEIELLTSAYEVSYGDVIIIMPKSGKYFNVGLKSFICDNQERKDMVLSFNNDLMKIRIPTDLDVGTHFCKILLKDNYEGNFSFRIIKKNKLYDEPDDYGYNPDPTKNKPKPINLSNQTIPISYRKTVFIPTGGYLNENKENCSKLHKIDGIFTDSLVNNYPEWTGVTPLIGRFSNLYLDYCSSDRILYVMNDWRLGNGDYDTNTCYNEFEFFTENGAKKWIVKVWNNFTKGTEVFLNGVNVSKDTNYVIGGRYGYSKSLLVDTPHTLWEFGIKTNTGLFTMRLYRDEVGWLDYTPKVRVVCNDEGYGLIYEPYLVTANLQDNGITALINERYIPIGGIQGMLVEPHTYSGIIAKDSIVIYDKDQKRIKNSTCQSPHKIDGKFTNDSLIKNEWKNIIPAEGRYSLLFADYCNGILYILNDWKVAKLEPFQPNCYNVFELYTGGGSEHWGIIVFNDPGKKIKVFRNGVDVSDDKNIVLEGAYGFDISPGDTMPNCIYEFAIKANEGPWHLFLCDPGPSSFCDDWEGLPPREWEIFCFPRVQDENNKPGSYSPFVFSNSGDSIELIFGNSSNYNKYFAKKVKLVIEYDSTCCTFKDAIPITTNSLIFNSSFTKTVTENKITIEGVLDTTKPYGDIAKVTFNTHPAIEPTRKCKITGKIFLANNTHYIIQSQLPEVEVINLQNSGQQFPLSYVSMYPNPINKGNDLTITFYNSPENSYEISIYDLKGKIAVNKTIQTKSNALSQTTLPTGILESGVYLLIIKSKTGLIYYTNKLIVVNN